MIKADVDMPKSCYGCWFSRFQDDFLLCGPTNACVNDYIDYGRHKDCILTEVKNND